MSYSDRDLMATAERDQDEATIKDMARDLSLMYSELRRGGVPKEIAGSVLALFAATVVFPGCGCEMSG